MFEFRPSGIGDSRLSLSVKSTANLSTNSYFGGLLEVGVYLGVWTPVCADNGKSLKWTKDMVKYGDHRRHLQITPGLPDLRLTLPKAEESGSSMFP